MATRRDRTNQFGYVCPTENEAIRNVDHEARAQKARRTTGMTEAEIRHQGVQRSDVQKRLESLSEFLDGPVDPNLKRMRAIFNTLASVSALAGVRIDRIRLRIGEKYYTEEDLRN